MPPSPPPSATPRDGRTSPTVSVVIPAVNQAAALPHVLRALPPVDEVIVVDGGSTDGTVAAARAARPGTQVVRQTRAGTGNALTCGIAAARGDVVVTLTADGSTDPAEIPRLAEAVLAGADIAAGSRYRDGGGDLTGGRAERLCAAVLSRMAAVFLGARCTDPSWGAYAFRRAAVPALDLPGTEVPGLKRGRRAWGDGAEIAPLVVVRAATAGLRVVEVPSVRYPRMDGQERRDLLRRVLLVLRTLVMEVPARRRTRTARPAHLPSPAVPEPRALAAPRDFGTSRAAGGSLAGHSSPAASSRTAEPWDPAEPRAARLRAVDLADADRRDPDLRGPDPSALSDVGGGPRASGAAEPPAAGSWPAAASRAAGAWADAEPRPARARFHVNDPWSPSPGDRGATGRHAAPPGSAAVPPPRRAPLPSGLPAAPPPARPEPPRRAAAPSGLPPADRRRGYPVAPRAAREPGAHRTVDITAYDTGVRRGGRVYDTGVHHLPDDGSRRSGLYDTGVHRVGVYESGIHRTDVYDTGAHHLPDEDGPMYRRSAPREVGGGRRRMDARDRRADGRPDLTVIPGEGDPGRDSGRDGRPGHLRAVPGERPPR